MTTSPPLVILTGGLGGVGVATTALLRTHALRVIVLDKIAPSTPTDDFYACDVTDSTALRAVVAEIVAQVGVPDVWVNNAGFGKWGPFDPADSESDIAEMAVNYHGSVRAIRAILPYWREQGRGHLIQITSSSALFPAPNMATYAASKGAIRAFVQSLRVELQGSGITVTEIVPNTIDTPMSAGQNRRWIPKIASIRPDLTPDDVARAIQRAIRKRPREVHVPRLVTLFWWLVGSFPAVVDRLVGWGNPKNGKK